MGRSKQDLMTAADHLEATTYKTGQILKKSKEQYDLSNRQARIADKQFKLSIFLTVVALLIGIVPFLIDQNKSLNKSIGEIKQQQSVTIKVLSSELDSINHHVKSLEKQIELLSRKLE